MTASFLFCKFCEMYSDTDVILLMLCAGKNLYNNEHVAIKLVIYVVFVYAFEYLTENLIVL